MINSNLIKQLKKHEGLSNKSYQDSEGVWTIGYGHNLQVLKISKKQAEVWLIEDIEKAANDLIKYESKVIMLNQVRKNVLINMTFNLGISGLINFKKMWKAIKKEDYKKAAKEMLDSKWANQVGYRSIELSNQMRNGK